MSTNNSNTPTPQTGYYYGSYQYPATNYPPPNQQWNWTAQQQQQFHRNVPPPPINTYNMYTQGQFYQTYTDQRAAQQQYNSSQANRGQQYNFAAPPPPPPPAPKEQNSSYYSPSQNRTWMQEYHSPTGNSNNHNDHSSMQGHNRSRIQRLKRNVSESSDCERRKKKKKPLSQKNLPTRSKWTRCEAQRALEFEKEFNKLSKNSLIIKFPDFPISREMVTNYHGDINSIYFPTPVGPRNCFISLKPNSDPDEVIKALEEIVPEGASGPLKVEVKLNKGDTKPTKPEDIDPLTLYVGNLASEVSKDDIVAMFPRHRRIDIGFAKKMKFTRYAFIVFHTCAEALEAFKTAFNADLHGKSLIVRFRRVHGTVGMPGEMNTQNPSNFRVDSDVTVEAPNTSQNLYENDTQIPYDNDTVPKSDEKVEDKVEVDKIKVERCSLPPPPPPDSGSTSETSEAISLPVSATTNTKGVTSSEQTNGEVGELTLKEPVSDSKKVSNVNLAIVKQEPVQPQLPYLPGDIDSLFAQCRPMVIKTEPDAADDISGQKETDDGVNVQGEPANTGNDISEEKKSDEGYNDRGEPMKIKEEPPMSDEEDFNNFAFDEELKRIQMYNQKTQELRLKSKQSNV